MFTNVCTQVFAIMFALTGFQAFLSGKDMSDIVKDIERTSKKLTFIFIINSTC